MTFARSDVQIMIENSLDRLLSEENDFERRRSRLAPPAPDRLALWPALAELGVFGTTLPEELGGFGGGMRDIAVVMAAMGRSLAVEPYLETAICARLLPAAAGDFVTALAADLLSGQRRLSLIHGTAFDPFAAPSVTALKTKEGWRLSGESSLVRHGDLADGFLVVAALSESGEIGSFFLDGTAAGISREAFRLMDASSAARIVLRDTPATPLLTGEAASAALRDALEIGIVGLAAEAVAILRALNAATFEYLGTRRQFGVPLASFQALQHRAADMHIAAEEAEIFTERVIDSMDAPASDARSRIVSALKALIDEAGRKVGHEAVQLHGGMGVSDELNVSHYMRRLATIRAQLGGADLHRGRCAAYSSKSGSMLLHESEAATAFRQEVRQFVIENLPADLAAKGRLGLELERSDYVRWQKILQAKGWFAAAWPREYGGAGWDLRQQLIFTQESALNNAPPLSPYGVKMVGPVLYTFGNDEQKARFLPGILSSDTWWCQGYSEPNSGSDLASLKTFAQREGDHYVVNGTKMWTTEAHWADMMHCLVRTTREGRPQQGISFLLIDMKTPGVTVRPIVTIDGQHHTNQIFFDDVRVPVENLVGKEGQGWTIAKFLLANERVAIADTGPKLKLLGDLKRSLDELSGAHLPEEVRIQLVHKLAQVEIRLLTLCALEQQYVEGWASGGSKEGPEASTLKIRGTEILQQLSEVALELEGWLAAAHDPADLHLPAETAFSPAQRASLIGHQYLYGRCWSIFGGTNEIQRNIIARAILPA